MPRAVHRARQQGSPPAGFSSAALRQQGHRRAWACWGSGRTLDSTGRLLAGRVGHPLLSAEKDSRFGQHHVTAEAKVVADGEWMLGQRHSEFACWEPGNQANS